jgi:hypothetical protein
MNYLLGTSGTNDGQHGLPRKPKKLDQLMTDIS